MTTIFERLSRGRPAPVGEEKVKVDPAQKLLDWLQRHWDKPTISRRDIYMYGPACTRKREDALNAAEVLVRHGWLAPHKTHRHDWRVWEISRRPVIRPTIAT